MSVLPTPHVSGRLGRALLLVAGLAAGALGGAPAASAQVAADGSRQTFTPVADARVEKRNETKNHGRDPNLQASSSPQIESYIRFAVRDAKSTITSAKLRLYVTRGTDNAPVLLTSATGWSESTLNWRTRPAKGAQIADAGTARAGQWLEYDVSAAVRGNGEVSFVTVGESSTRMDWNSREASAPPQLVVESRQDTTTSPTQPPALPGADPVHASPLPASGVPVGPLVFRDEFDGTALNLDKWRPNWLAGTDTAITKPVNSSEKACYDPKQVTVSGGAAVLTAIQRDCTANNGITYPHASGLIQSNSDFRFTYGYSEARIWLEPNSNPEAGNIGSCGPNWAAFWTNGKNWPADGEIDVMECLGDNVAWHYHHTSGSTGRTPSMWKGTMPPSLDGWHTFGVEWRPGSLRYFYDGVLVGTLTSSNVTSSPHYLIANLAISGTKIKVPQRLLIDYVRVWE